MHRLLLLTAIIDSLLFLLLHHLLLSSLSFSLSLSLCHIVWKFSVGAPECFPRYDADGSYRRVEHVLHASFQPNVRTILHEICRLVSLFCVHRVLYFFPPFFSYPARPRPETSTPGSIAIPGLCVCMYSVCPISAFPSERCFLSASFPLRLRWYTYSTYYTGWYTVRVPRNINTVYTDPYGEIHKIRITVSTECIKSVAIFIRNDWI